MKFSKALTAVLATAFVGDAAPAAGNVDRVLEVVSENGHVRPGHFLDRRRDQVSQQCIDDSMALMENSEIVASADQLSQACANYMVQDGPSTVTIDWTDCEAAKSFKGICTNGGGMPVMAPTLTVSCVLGEENVALVMKGIPDCIGSSCDLDTISEEQDALLTELEQGLETELGAQCEVQSTPTGTSTASSIALSSLSIGGAVALFAFLQI